MHSRAAESIEDRVIRRSDGGEGGVAGGVVKGSCDGAWGGGREYEGGGTHSWSHILWDYFGEG